jgi:hypothetical protein
MPGSLFCCTRLQRATVATGTAVVRELAAGSSATRARPCRARGIRATATPRDNTDRHAALSTTSTATALICSFDDDRRSARRARRAAPGRTTTATTATTATATAAATAAATADAAAAHAATRRRLPIALARTRRTSERADEQRPEEAVAPLVRAASYGHAGALSRAGVGRGGARVRGLRLDGRGRRVHDGRG